MTTSHARSNSSAITAPTFTTPPPLHSPQEEKDAFDADTYTNPDPKQFTPNRVAIDPSFNTRDSLLTSHEDHIPTSRAVPAGCAMPDARLSRDSTGDAWGLTHRRLSQEVTNSRSALEACFSHDVFEPAPHTAFGSVDTHPSQATESGTLGTFTSQYGE